MKDINTYVLDTSVLLNNASSIRSFGSKNVVIPYTVLNELDTFKTKEGELGRNCRQAIRELNELRTKGKLHEGVQVTEAGGVLTVLLNNYSGPGLDFKVPDDRILGVALSIKHELDSKTNNSKVILVTKDINLSVKAESFGIEAKDFNSDKLVECASDLYTGTNVLSVPTTFIDRIHSSKDSVFANELQEITGKEVLPNQYFELIGLDNPSVRVLARVKGKNMRIVPIKNNLDCWGVSPKNKEQHFALDAALDTDISLVTLIGKAGSGKSLCALAAALEQVHDLQVYDKLIVSRPIQAMGNDLGYLPGPQPLDAGVLTTDGWTTMGDIKEGDKVITRDGSPSEVLAVYPKGEKVVYKVVTDEGTSTECCEDHLWLTQTQDEMKEGKEGSVKLLKNIIDSMDEGVVHYIPRNGPVQLTKKDVLIPPYTLGRLLGEDGETKLVESWRTVLDKIGLKKGVKFIPVSYLDSNIEDRTKVMQGILHNRGTIHNGEIVFNGKDKDFCEDVIELTQSLGGCAILSIQNEKDKALCPINKNEEQDVTCYQFTLTFPDSIEPIRFSPKSLEYDRSKGLRIDASEGLKTIRISHIEMSEIKEVQCILIENEEHLYITDDFLVTHNTVQEKLDPWMGPIKDSICFLSKGTKEDGISTYDHMIETGMLEVEALTYIRGRSIPNTLFLLDEAQDLSRGEIKTIVSRMGENSKLIITGDVMQISNPYLDATNTGLASVIERFKKEFVSAHITLQKGERSELATLAGELL